MHTGAVALTSILGIIAVLVQAAIFWDGRRRDRLEASQVGEKKEPSALYQDSWSLEEWRERIHCRNRFKRSVRRPVKRVVKRRKKPFDK